MGDKSTEQMWLIENLKPPLRIWRDLNDPALAVRNVVVLFEGTGNDFHRMFSNVTRVKNELISNEFQEKPLCYDGVGVATSWLRHPIKRIKNLSMGLDSLDILKRAYYDVSCAVINLKRCGISSNLYIFGFSRGAMLARALAVLVENCGVVDTLLSCEDVAKMLNWDVEDKISSAGVKFMDARVTYLGLWDTVNSTLKVSSNAILRSRSMFCRHAVSIHERRSTYDYVPLAVGQLRTPLRIQERFFAGTHSDVGGNVGHCEALGKVAFGWVINGAIYCGLLTKRNFYPEAIKDADIRIYDSSKDVSGLWQTVTRITNRWLYHDSVYDFIKGLKKEENYSANDTPKIMVMLRCFTSRGRKKPEIVISLKNTSGSSAYFVRIIPPFLVLENLEFEGCEEVEFPELIGEVFAKRTISPVRHKINAGMLETIEDVCISGKIEYYDRYANLYTESFCCKCEMCNGDSLEPMFDECSFDGAMTEYHNGRVR